MEEPSNDRCCGYPRCLGVRRGRAAPPMLYALTRAAPPSGCAAAATRTHQGVPWRDRGLRHPVPPPTASSTPPRSVCRHRCTGVTGSRATRQPPTSETSSASVVRPLPVHDLPSNPTDPEGAGGGRGGAHVPLGPTPPPPGRGPERRGVGGGLAAGRVTYPSLLQPPGAERKEWQGA